MPVRSLGYLRLATPNLDAYCDFAEGIVGMMPVDGVDGTRRLRTDDRPFRLELVPADAKGVVAIGLEISDDRDLEATVGALTAAGVDVVVASDDECERLAVTGLARLTDPSGMPIELFYGPILDHVPVQTPLISRFVTGGQGMGHVVVGAPNLDASDRFFRDLLGFRLRNTMRFRTPAPDGSTKTTHLHFLGCNPRHHTIGLLGMPFPGTIVHFMVETADIDDVGRALDRVHDQNVPISMTLGRHTNDHMVSFYCSTPDGYSVEIGCGGLAVTDDEHETTYEITNSSFWGHRRPGSAAG